ncbi:probable cytochrome P450, partial [Thalassiosira pseudonana CCMP1335]
MPFKYPILGTLPDFISRGGVDSLSQIYLDMYRDYGSVYGMSILGDDELIICDPKVFDKYVVRAEDKYPIGGAEAVTTFTDFYKENNLTKALEGTGHGPEWKAWRKSLDPDMYVAWETYLPTIADAANKISKVAGTSNIEFVDFLSRSAFDMFTA